MTATRNVDLRPIFLVFFLLSFSGAYAQQNLYDTDQLSAAFHFQKRAELRALMPENSCAIFFSNPVRNRSNDVDFQYSQDPDFYYLTGLTEPDAMLILFKKPVTMDGLQTDEIIYVQDRALSSETWNGRRLGKDGVVKNLGFQTVFINKEFTQKVPDFSALDKVLIKFPTDIGESSGYSKGSLNWLVFNLKSELQKADKEYQVPMLLKFMARMREIKSTQEIELMQKAIDMSAEGLNEACKAIEPGMREYEAQAIVEYYFKKNGSEYPGYNSICGSGENSCILHYETNRRQMEKGDLIVMDMGAEYHGYSADITRTYPVSGVFTQDQRMIYDLVLKAQEAGIQMVRKGNGFYDAHKAASDVIAKGLVNMGIIKSESEVKQYFIHGASHYLGLEVHDAGTYQPLRPGNIITVEPGIYIPEGSPCDKKYWNIGVRIEDDVLVTENDPVVMSAKFPKTSADIEKTMSEKSIFNEVK